MRMYLLIKGQYASMRELQEVYSLDEALKLYALVRMDQDVKYHTQKEAEYEAKRGGR